MVINIVIAVGGYTYKIPRPNTPRSLILRRNFICRFQTGYIGRISTYKSVVELRAPDRYGRMVGLMHLPGIAMFHARAIGEHEKMVAKRIATWVTATKTMPKVIRMFDSVCGEKTRR